MSSTRPMRECTYCRLLKDPEEVKMCSACKVCGYCSRECQKADWQTHKPVCRDVKNKTSTSRDPVIKIAERLLLDDDIMGWIESIAAVCLDMVNHPDNANKYAVMLLARAVADEPSPPTGTQHSSQTPVKTLKTLQIVRASRLPNDSAPQQLNDIAKEGAEGLRKGGHGRGWHFLRILWISEHTKLATLYLARPFNDLMIDFLRDNKQPGPLGIPIPVTTQFLIDQVNSQPRKYPDIKRKMTINTSTEGSAWENHPLAPAWEPPEGAGYGRLFG